MTNFETQNDEVADGINYEYYYAKANDDSKPTLLFLHGFPSSFHCWRHQINYFAKQGYGCLAPNLMGYGKTYSPLDSNAFRTKSMVEHLISLLDHLKLDKVIVLGHDWGTRPACRFVLYHPERTLGLVLFNVGYRKPVQLDLQKVFEICRQVFGYELIGYWEFFNSDDAAKLIEENADRFIDIAYTTEPELWKTDLAPLGKAREWLSSGKTTTRASYMTDEDYEVVRKCLTENMKSKLNWYTSAINNVDWNDEKDLDPKLKRPVLYIGGTKDYICAPKQFADQKEQIADLEIVEIETSHWTMEEKPDEVNQILEKWMQKFL